MECATLQYLCTSEVVPPFLSKYEQLTFPDILVSSLCKPPTVLIRSIIRNKILQPYESCNNDVMHMPVTGSDPNTNCLS